MLWPLVLPLFLLLPRAWGRALAAVALALASAAAMRVIVASGGDLTRAYFGTDTHAFGILLGVALAFLLRGAARHGAADASRGDPWPPLRRSSAAPPIALAPGWTIVYPKSLVAVPPTPAPRTGAGRTAWKDRRLTRAVVSIAGLLAIAGIVAIALHSSR